MFIIANDPTVLTTTQTMPTPTGSCKCCDKHGTCMICSTIAVQVCIRKYLNTCKNQQ